MRLRQCPRSRVPDYSHDGSPDVSKRKPSHTVIHLETALTFSVVSLANVVPPSGPKRHGVAQLREINKETTWKLPGLVFNADGLI